MPKNKLMDTVKVMILLFAVVLNSCVTTQKSIYFDNIQDKEFPEESIVPVIQNSDILNISVSSLNPEATAIFNSPIQSANNYNNNNFQPGYLVNTEGNILFPILGKIKVSGLTIKQLTDELVNTLFAKKLLVDPIVNVRIMNFKVTVLGEVAKPSVVPVANEKISMLEAIGMAGDMTLYAIRDNVLLIRVENGKKITRRVNLNSSNFLESPYYYLKNNDVVYVEPNKAKVATTGRSQQVLPLVFSALTFVAIIVERIIFKK